MEHVNHQNATTEQPFRHSHCDCTAETWLVGKSDKGIAQFSQQALLLPDFRFCLLCCCCVLRVRFL